MQDRGSKKKEKFEYIPNDVAAGSQVVVGHWMATVSLLIHSRSKVKKAERRSAYGTGRRQKRSR